MKIETKFNLGQEVWTLTISHFQRSKIECSACNSTGQLTIQETGEHINCTECGGHAVVWIDKARRSYYACRTYIGKIITEHYGLRESVPEHLRGVALIKYMVESTGVHSGQVWSEDRLFATEAELEQYKKEYEDGKTNT